MKPPFRIAVLECAQPLPSVQEKYGTYGDIFRVLLQSGADTLGMPEVVSSKKGLEVSKWDVVYKQEYPSLEDVDAVLMSGSQFTAFHDDPWILKLVDYTKKILAQRRVRVIGVCFGHQIIARAMGAKVGQNADGWEIAVTPMDLTAKGKELFKVDRLNIHQMHRDIAFEHPEGVEALGSSPVCSVQGMYAKGRLISVQGHPEFNQEIETIIIKARHAQGIFTDALFEDAMGRVGKHHDGAEVSAAFLRFLLED
ncbi:class I glutamine amidotransferase-like protein [Lophium mytilinum]|uniref:Class I glutamine amidotransferase-like protein n=1 Tax=Lophium mytilinum TaxID=390894 RepID=A0A6A6QPR2_9PEZI|nr:class I glutamine amidotransferase-like protein [Lophium mytilinum]